MESTTQMEPRRVRVQVRDEQGRMLDEWFVEVYPSGDDKKDARHGISDLEALLTWGPEGWPKRPGDET